MGLDMYLNCVESIDSEVQVNSNISDEEMNNLIKEGSVTLNLIMYWRKCNMIHNWFEQNVADGNIYNCSYYQVTIEQLIELKNLIEQVYNNHELAPNLLPTQEGFFFGSTDYDEYYFSELKNTLDELTEIIHKHTDNYKYFYMAWW
ncbi:hypothetical protein RW115_12125 [Macrococcus capreoli]